MDGVDMISELPDHILHLILSRLPTTEEVIRTRILSKRWSHLWASVASIDIDFSQGQNPLKSHTENLNMFAEFVDWVLANKSVNLDTFRLHCKVSSNISTIKRWIEYIAVMRRVKVVDLMICPEEFSDMWDEDQGLEVPHSLVSCGSLEVLRLDLFKRGLTLPLVTGFPALRVLELNRVVSIDSGLVQHLLESCPSLEELSMINCCLDCFGEHPISSAKLKKLRIHNTNTGFTYGAVSISFENLLFLEFLGHVAISFSIERMDSLKKVVFHTEESFDPTDDTICSLFATISHAEFLSLNHYFLKVLDVPISLPNLKTLEITTTLDADFIDALIKFLTYSPHLESLHLIIQKEYLTRKHWIPDKSAEAMRILVTHLKSVEFLRFKGKKRELVVIGSLLKHGNLLEEMVFNWKSYHSHKSMKIMKIMKKVSMFPKASSTVKLTTLIND